MIPVNIPWFDGNEKKYLLECIDTGWISSEGPFVKKFEEHLAETVSRKYAISVCNGSAALDCALLALDLPPRSEVILPTFTIISCAASIVRANCLPVLVDSDQDSWNMKTDEIEKKITNRTKAIMVVHIYGLPVDMDPILSLAEKYGLTIIEDAAEQHGQYYQNQPIGSFGKISIFSFYPNKHITTGEGGMILTNDEKLAERCRSIRNLCFLPHKRFMHEELGFNYRMSNLQAAVGLAQLEQLDKFVNKKRAIGEYYYENLKHVRSLQLPVPKTSFANNIYWVFGLVISKDFKMNAEEAMKKLADVGIGTRPFFFPMHMQPVFKKLGLFQNESYPVAESLAEQGLYIPSGLGITLNEQEEVVQKVKAIFQ